MFIPRIYFILQEYSRNRGKEVSIKELLIFEIGSFILIRNLKDIVMKLVHSN